VLGFGFVVGVVGGLGLNFWGGFVCWVGAGWGVLRGVGEKKKKLIHSVMTSQSYAFI